MNSEEYEEGVSDDEGEVLGEDDTTGEGRRRRGGRG